MIDDSAPTDKKRKIIKIYKNVLSKNGLWLLTYARRYTIKKKEDEKGGVEKGPQR